ncbi:hypothetical protein ACFO5R_07265 [Halosolutus amylolyticus]|uniref:Small CPxCG-related zinc finger protein n=1 Tax=Halosolutus amylolyticus TaxID=2932267 RepID=A0ABD5PPB2_9EURY|nr:hypothetical protein [Halosolutus amylolyticus]
MTDRSRSSGRSVRAAIAGLFGGRSRTVVVECRRCGTSVERGARACPTCNCDDIVTYTIR